MKVDNIEKFKNKASIIHNNKYNYEKSIYNGNKEKLIITCLLHGDFSQTPHEHLSKRGCRDCANLRLRNKFGKNNEDFIKEANLIHNYFYNYSETNYINRSLKVDIICPKHGLFKQLPKHHLNYSGCPVCKSSKGEKIITNYLINNNIKYIPQFTFDNCIGKKKKLPFDFFLPDYNICLEFDGMQHYSDKHFHFNSNGKINEKFNDRVENDLKKTNYCINNNIRLLRIKYTDMDKIEIIINDILKILF